MVATAPASIRETLKQWSHAFDGHINAYLAPGGGAPAELVEAMRYSMLAPGKRLRPFLVDRCFRLAEGQGTAIISLCVAVECLHVFTLIHDDLPAMDNADLRRGKPSSHRVFGEGLAILTGDALLAYGIELASRASLDAAKSLKIVQILTDAIGRTGVIGGQVVDILSEGKPSDVQLTGYIHRRKTARLFQACCCSGAIAAGADERTFNNLSSYGLNVGLAFQIADDLLDVTGTTDAVGKKLGRDTGLHRQTYPAAVGIEESRRLGEQAVTRAVAALQSFGAETDELRQIAQFVMSREN